MAMSVPAVNTQIDRCWVAIVFHAAAAVVLLLCSMPVAAKPPNIILVLADDLGIESIGDGAYWPNRLDCITPGLVRLASQGRVFSHARVNPRCSPTRAGVLSGRVGLKTGVTGLQVGADADTVRLGLQTGETTLAEALQSQGYQTFFVGKWHVGTYVPWGQRPEQQGFEIVEEHRTYLPLDDPIEVGDEHVTLMSNIAIDVVNNRASLDRPYVLFLWEYDPHERRDETYQEMMRWWRVDESLLPSGEPYYHENRADDTTIDRYRAVVEAYDNELMRVFREIGVTDASGVYQPDSNTIVFFIGDNGENDKISPWPGRSKGTVYECGVRVPLFVFGEGVPADGADSNRLIMHTDLFDTICDVAGVPDEERGTRPRDSMSFADAIGWSDPLPERVYQILSQEDSTDSNNLLDQRVTLVGERYKLIAQAGGTGLAALDTDEFYDLEMDPHENTDLVSQGMNAAEKAVYLEMRDAIVDYWFTSVCEATEQMIDIPMTHAMSLVSTNHAFVKEVFIGHAYPEEGLPHLEARAFYRFDVAAIDALLPPEKTLDDVASAQIVLLFGEDSQDVNETDTGVIHAYPVYRDWYSRRTNWAEMNSAYLPLELGQVALAPHVVWNPSDPRLTGVPMSPYTPVSLGHSATLLEAVRDWHDLPADNFGIVLMADPDPDLGGDQHVTFKPQAFLRLTMKP